jgi:Transglutaminase-like superfamily
MDWTRQTRFSDPGRHHDLLTALPDDVAAINAAVRNLTVHYRASGIDFPPDRLAEIDTRWVSRMLDLDQERFAGVPLDAPRPEAERLVGCCRDAALLTVSALRARGVPARTRIGFAGYLASDYHVDHVIAEYHDGSRWVGTDPDVGLAVVERGPAGLHTAAQSWRAMRRGEIDPATYGTGPGQEIGGPWMILHYLMLELAHRMGDELLLWDIFGQGIPFADREWSELPVELPEDLTHLDEIADLLLAADAGDEAAERKLEARYTEDPRLHPGPAVRCVSPRGAHHDVALT